MDKVTELKLYKCPNCGETLHSDCWTTGRKLQQRCNECGWQGEPRVPETREIETTKKVMVGQFYGFQYNIFDRYGHVMTISRYYHIEEEAIDKMKDDLIRHNKQSEATPCTAVLYPDTVIVKGKVFR